MMGPPPPRTTTAEPSTSQPSSSMPPPPPRITSTPNSAPMAPPPSANPTSVTEESTSTSSELSTAAAPMAPPPPKNLQQSPPQPPRTLPEDELTPMDTQIDQSEIQIDHSEAQIDNSNSEMDLSEPEMDNLKAETITGKKKQEKTSALVVPYTIPDWSGAPCHHFSFEVLKQGAIIDKIDVNKKGAYMFGRVDICDFILEHPTVSRFHAVLQFKSNGEAFMYDLGSTHGTYVNKKEVKKRVYVDLRVGDVVRFGQSSRLYIFQGPPDLMPMEGDLKRVRNAKLRQDVQDMEASLRRAKLEASRADGISWGMGEDAIEENEDEIEEITWQSYKGQLTEKQEKTREKVIKRLEKIAHMKKEIDAIRAKDISQGGLTQGQQTQIARNEQRIAQIMEELENLEETLNESIRESLGARAGGMSRGKKKGLVEEDGEEYLSDDDEFYDRTVKSSKPKAGENPSVETADTLLDKKDILMKEMEETRKLLMDEDKKTDTNEVGEAGDALDAYMSSVSSQLVLDTKEKLQKELSALQSELDRILYLLKIADPTGEASRKRESEGQKPKEIVKNNPALPAPDSRNRSSTEKNHKSTLSPEKNKNVTLLEIHEDSRPEGLPATPIQDRAADVETSESSKPEEKESACDSTECKVSDTVEGEVSDTTEGGTTVYAVTKPQWLGAVDEMKKQETEKEAIVDMDDTDQFIDYKDRGAKLQAQVDTGIEEAAPGLIIRKRKQVTTSMVSEAKDSDMSIEPEFKAEEAVALLLKHSKAYHVLDADESLKEDVPFKNRNKKDAKKAKRVLGPEKPATLDDEPEHSTWVPPKGQSGDGRTSLNDRFGY